MLLPKIDVNHHKQHFVNIVNHSRYNARINEMDRIGRMAFLWKSLGSLEGHTYRLEIKACSPLNSSKNHPTPHPHTHTHLKSVAPKNNKHSRYSTERRLPLFWNTRIEGKMPKKCTIPLQHYNKPQNIHCHFSSTPTPQKHCRS